MLTTCSHRPRPGMASFPGQVEIQVWERGVGRVWGEPSWQKQRTAAMALPRPPHRRGGPRAVLCARGGSGKGRLSLPGFQKSLSLPPLWDTQAANQTIARTWGCQRPLPAQGVGNRAELGTGSYFGGIQRLCISNRCLGTDAGSSHLPCLGGLGHSMVLGLF